MKRILTSLTIIASLAIFPPVCPAQNAVKDKYLAIEVDKFDLRNGVEFPPEYLPSLQEAILEQVQSSKLFQQVLRPGENAIKPGAPVIRLTGTIEHFDPGSRAKRYVIGMGAGSTRIFAHLVFVDRTSGQPVATQDVTGVMSGGFLGGNSEKVLQEFASRVAIGISLIARKSLSEVAAGPTTSSGTSGTVEPAAGANATVGQPAATPLETPPASSSPVPGAVVLATNPDRHTINFSAHDFSGAESKLNAEASAGYRLADFVRTGHDSAEIIFEKLTTSEKYEYLVLHARLAGTMEKEMNRAAEEGYRFCPQAIGRFGGVMTAIFERSPGGARFTYRVHQMYESSVQEYIAKGQAEGYLLAASTSAASQGFPLVVLEKEVKTNESKPTGG